ncbi:ABC transporter substrate-binding protein [Massilia terrae]|uniref:ABC transporter substrate-binding protein n=1 Tax=Massilia terrae TaxID=1811224 RepID=A0ABT2CWT0_9BURK|nr:ABC transporter substrate-binding protein [Massilia terrae]MCS0658421.1 ABC transporter substrate-binding protein [Massilia terrae]
MIATPRIATRRRQLLRAAAALPLAGLAPAWAQPEKLVIGGLPVTCNLTLPVACEAAGRNGRFAFSKYGGWAELKESLMTGRIQAAYMLAPLVMDLADSRIPLKIVSLGHRSGAVIMVRTDAPIRRFSDLKGRRVAIPSRFAVDYIFLRKMLAREGMNVRDIEIIEMAPPDMPAALYAKAVDAYCTGEPFGAAAQNAGYARPLALTRDEWRNYICCVLTVREDLIRNQPGLVQELVNYVQASGHWLDAAPANREKAVQIASRRDYFNQDPKIIRFVMNNPADRVTYGDLRMIRAEFEDLMQLSLQAGTLRRPVAYERYVDERFVRAISPVPITL